MLNEKRYKKNHHYKLFISYNYKILSWRHMDLLLLDTLIPKKLINIGTMR
jgi:hypothetical protein